MSKTFDVQCIWGRILESLEKIFVFKYSKTIFMEKVLQGLFWTIFVWAHIPFKRYQNTSGSSTGSIYI